MDNNDKRSAQLAAAKGKRLEELTKHSGWQDIVEMLMVYWDNALETLRNDTKDINLIIAARERMKAVEELAHQIGITVGFGEQARKRLEQKTKGE